MFASYAAIFVPPGTYRLDADVPRNRWGRIVIDGCLPPGTDCRVAAVSTDHEFETAIGHQPASVALAGAKRYLGRLSHQPIQVRVGLDLEQPIPGVPPARLGDVHPHRRKPLAIQRCRGLQPGNDGHLVFGGRAAEYDAY